MNFQTFLLDRNNRVIAIGNPIYNPKVKELYLKIIKGEKIERRDESKVIKQKWMPAIYLFRWVVLIGRRNKKQLLY